MHKQSNDGCISPLINAIKRQISFSLSVSVFFLAFKITKSQSLGSCSFVNIYSYLYHYNRRKGMSGLFKCQLTKRFLHSVLCCCVETLKKRPLSVIPRLSHGTTCNYMYLWEFSCNCVNTNYTPWVTLSTVYKMRIKRCSCFRVVIFYFFPLGSQTDMYVG